MSVAKVIEISSTSNQSFEDAINQGVKRAADSVENVRGAWIKDQKVDDWVGNFRAAAKFPNMFCKLSGMITEADWKNWKPAHLKPYVQEALASFGPDRLMFGSDWPVSNLAGSYQQLFDALGEALGPISETERNKIFGETAIEFYGLKVG